MIWNGPSYHDSIFDALHQRLLNHDNTWLGTLYRKAWGYTRYADPRKNLRATKKYADGRQKKGGK